MLIPAAQRSMLRVQLGAWLLMLVISGTLCAAVYTPADAPAPSPTPSAHHMEIFGMGPELWGDRAKAWVLALWEVADTVVAKAGVLSLAILAVIQNLKSKASIKEVKERQDRQGERLDKVALAVPSTPLPTVAANTPSGQAVAVAPVTATGEAGK